MLDEDATTTAKVNVMGEKVRPTVLEWRYI